MDYFWYTSDNIPKGLGFSHFDGFHLAWLLAGAAVIFLSCLWYRKLREKHRGIFRKTAALLLVADELFLVLPMIAMGVFRAAYLPFELCSINLFLIAWHAWKPNRTLGLICTQFAFPAPWRPCCFPPGPSCLP